MLEEELYTLKTKPKINPFDKYLDNKFDILLNNQVINQETIKSNLTKDILDYQKFVINHRDNYEDTNEKIIERIQNKINSINRNYKAKLYGSRATNLCLMWSDIDIVICNEKRKGK